MRCPCRDSNRKLYQYESPHRSVRAPWRDVRAFYKGGWVKYWRRKSMFKYVILLWLEHLPASIRHFITETERWEYSFCRHYPSPNECHRAAFSFKFVIFTHSFGTGGWIPHTIINFPLSRYEILPNSVKLSAFRFCSTGQHETVLLSDLVYCQGVGWGGGAMQPPANLLLSRMETRTETWRGPKSKCLWGESTLLTL